MDALEDVHSIGGYLECMKVFNALEDISSALGRYQYCYGASPMH